MSAADHADHADLAAASDADGPTCSRRSLQLRRWVRQLASRLVSGQEGMVLPRAWQGLPWSGMRASWDHLAPVRLQCGLRQLDGWMECPKEDVVLPEWRKGLPTSSGRVRLSRMDSLVCRARSRRCRTCAIFGCL